MTNQYEIYLKDHLDVDWEDWFAGFSISHLPDGSTLLRGPIADQPALHGLLARIGDLGLTLLKIEQIKQEAENE